MSPYDLSLQDWLKAGLTLEDWRKAGRDLWIKIMASPHYHDGRTCTEAHCPNGLRRPAMIPKAAAS